MDLLLTLEELYCVAHQCSKKQNDVRTNVVPTEMWELVFHSCDKQLYSCVWFLITRAILDELPIFMLKFKLTV